MSLGADGKAMGLNTCRLGAWLLVMTFSWACVTRALGPTTAAARGILGVFALRKGGRASGKKIKTGGRAQGKQKKNSANMIFSDFLVYPDMMGFCGVFRVHHHIKICWVFQIFGGVLNSCVFYRINGVHHPTKSKLERYFWVVYSKTVLFVAL